MKLKVLNKLPMNKKETWAKSSSTKEFLSLAAKLEEELREHLITVRYEARGYKIDGC